MVYYFTDRRDEALIALSIGIEEVEELGDSDIQSQSAVFLGFYYFILGMFEQAAEYLEKANHFHKNSKDLIIKDPMFPLLLGYCAIYLGQFHKAIGSLDYYIREAGEQSNKMLASTIRAILGTVLVLLRKEKEAGIHLGKAQNDALATGNKLGLYFCRGGMALSHFQNMEMEKSHEILISAIEEGNQFGLVRQFASPWILEMLYEFHRRGFAPIPNLSLPDVMDRVMNGVNIHLQGVCLRLKASMIFGQGGAHSRIADYLSESLTLLRKSGDPVQIAKTLLEISRLELVKGHRNKARQKAQEAREMLGGYIEEFFPDALQTLLESKAALTDRGLTEEDFLNKYLEMLESFYPSETSTEILSKMLSATSQIFRAERSGLFWFLKGRHTAEPELRASLNLSRTEIVSPDFKHSLVLIHKTFKENNPIVKKQRRKHQARERHLREPYYVYL